MLSSYPYFSDMQSFSQVKSRVVVFHLEISTKKVHPRKTNITMENHHFQWENPRNKWPFSIATLNYQRVHPRMDSLTNHPDFSLLKITTVGYIPNFFSGKHTKNYGENPPCY